MVKHRDLFRDAVRQAGSQAKLAEILGISQQGVSYILNRASSVPAEIAVAIDRFTNGEISKADLRPDIFGDAAQ